MPNKEEEEEEEEGWRRGKGGEGSRNLARSLAARIPTSSINHIYIMLETIIKNWGENDRVGEARKRANRKYFVDSAELSTKCRICCRDNELQK
jgi:hypothetical protein